MHGAHGDDVGGDGGEKIRNELVERGGIFVVEQKEALEGTGDAGLNEAVLSLGNLPKDSGDSRNGGGGERMENACRVTEFGKVFRRNLIRMEALREGVIGSGREFGHLGIVERLLTGTEDDQITGGFCAEEGFLPWSGIDPGDVIAIHDGPAGEGGFVIAPQQFKEVIEAATLAAQGMRQTGTQIDRFDGALEGEEFGIGPGMGGEAGGQRGHGQAINGHPHEERDEQGLGGDGVRETKDKEDVALGGHAIPVDGPARRALERLGVADHATETPALRSKLESEALALPVITSRFG